MPARWRRSLRTDLAVVAANTSIGAVRRDARLPRLAGGDPDGGSGHRDVPHLPGLPRGAPAPRATGVPVRGGACPVAGARRSARRWRACSRQALEAFRAEVAEIVFFSPDGSDALRTTVRADGRPRVLERSSAGIAEELRSLIETQERGCLRDVARSPTDRWPTICECGSSAGHVRGAQGRAQLDRARMMIGNPSGVVDRFSPTTSSCSRRSPTTPASRWRTIASDRPCGG